VTSISQIITLDSTGKVMHI